jgi:NAD(P)-dependent dehydrogenase (short-subunit alcohol dehydrogenase family)
MSVSNPFSLSGKTILITGASSGIGAITAKSIHQMGATPVLTGRNSSKLGELALSLGMKQGDYIPCDITQADELNMLAQSVPSLDGLVHCAGTVNPFPIKFLDQKKISETLRVNYEAPVLMMAALLKAKKMNANASLVFLSSISGQHPHKGGAMYGGSKAAIESFVKVLALELFPQGIRANCISPGMVKTPMYDKAANDMSHEEMDKHVAQYPLGVGYPEDVANACIYLLSPASRWVTGINLTLDGGFLLGK